MEFGALFVLSYSFKSESIACLRVVAIASHLLSHIMLAHLQVISAADEPARQQLTQRSQCISARLAESTLKTLSSFYQPAQLML